MSDTDDVQVQLKRFGELLSNATSVIENQRQRILDLEAIHDQATNEKSLRHRLRERVDELWKMRRDYRQALIDRDDALAKAVSLQRLVDRDAEQNEARDIAKQALLKAQPDLADKLCSMCDRADSPLVTNLKELGLAHWRTVCKRCMDARIERARADGKIKAGDDLPEIKIAGVTPDPASAEPSSPL